MSRRLLVLLAVVIAISASGRAFALTPIGTDVRLDNTTPNDLGAFQECMGGANQAPAC